MIVKALRVIEIIALLVFCTFLAVDNYRLKNDLHRIVEKLDDAAGMVETANYNVHQMADLVHKLDQSATRMETTYLHQTEYVTKVSSKYDDLVVKMTNFSEGIIVEDIIMADVTAYNNTVEQCDKDPHINAAGKMPEIGDIAVSRDLYRRGWKFGRLVKIEGLGIFRIRDTMNARFKKSIDIYVGDGQYVEFARKFGRRLLTAELLSHREDSRKEYDIQRVIQKVGYAY